MRLPRQIVFDFLGAIVHPICGGDQVGGLPLEARAHTLDLGYGVDVALAHGLGAGAQHLGTCVHLLCRLARQINQFCHAITDRITDGLQRRRGIVGIGLRIAHAVFQRVAALIEDPGGRLRAPRRMICRLVQFFGAQADHVDQVLGPCRGPV